MARIKKYKKDKPDEIEVNSKKTSIKKTEKKTPEKNINKEKSENETTSVKEKMSEASFKDTAINLLNLFGEDSIKNIKKNEHLQIPFTDEDITTEQWLEKALKTIFNENDVKIISHSLHNKYYSLINKLEKQQTEIKKLKSEIKKKEKEITTTEEESDKFFEENKKITKELEKSVSLIKVFELIFTENDQIGFLRLAKEAVEDNAGEETTNFFLSFMKEWMQILNIENNLNKEDEEQKVEIYDKLLRNLLLSIKDIHIPQRRAVLDALARYLNKSIENFIFLSPEETTQIDIDIHNAKGAGGNKIKQGLSFAVIRKQNRQTYKYADIEVF